MLRESQGDGMVLALQIWLRKSRDFSSILIWIILSSHLLCSAVFPARRARRGVAWRGEGLQQKALLLIGPRLALRLLRRRARAAGEPFECSRATDAAYLKFGEE